jgi:hypothetical protein
VQEGVCQATVDVEASANEKEAVVEVRVSANEKEAVVEVRVDENQMAVRGETVVATIQQST